MKRPAVQVLLLTFVALVVATLWLPSHDVIAFRQLAGGWPVWRWIGSVALQEQVHLGFGVLMTPVLDRTALAVEYALIITVGGLVALALHTRERRNESHR